MNIIKTILHFLIPPCCTICDKPGVYSNNICYVCWVKIPFIDDKKCSLCGLVINLSYDLILKKSFKCGQCRINPPLYDKAIAVISYESVAKKLIKNFKYQNKTFIGKELVKLILSKWQPFLENQHFQMIIHIPLHAKKLKIRGFDQAYILAYEIGKALNIRPTVGNLKRVKNTLTQTHLSRLERKENIKNAFTLINPSLIENRSILLVDDVYTTGATIEECTSLLIKAHASKIIVVTVARA